MVTTDVHRGRPRRGPVRAAKQAKQAGLHGERASRKPSGWAGESQTLHDVLAAAFSCLDLRDRVLAACVCRRWRTAAADPVAWGDRFLSARLHGDLDLSLVGKRIGDKGPQVRHLHAIFRDHLRGQVAKVLQQLNFILCQFPHLQSLNLDYCAVHEEGLKYEDVLSVPAMRAMPNLVTLRLDGRMTAKADRPGLLLLMLGRLTGLTSLNIHDYNTWDAWAILHGPDAQAVAPAPADGLGRFCDLKCLKELHASAVLAFPASINMPTALTKLHLHNMAWTKRSLGLLKLRGLLDVRMAVDDQFEKENPAKLVEVRADELERMLCTVQRLDWMAPIKLRGQMQLPRLSHLYSSYRRGLLPFLLWSPECQLRELEAELSYSTAMLSSAAVPHAYTCLTALTLLELDGASPGVATLKVLPRGPYLQGLRGLIVSEMSFSDTFWPRLALATALRSLDFQDCRVKVTDACEAALLQLTQLTALSVSYIEEALGEQRMGRIQLRMLNTRVEWND